MVVSRAIQELKKDVRDGVLGRPVRFKCLVLWPRPISYFQRNDWAGKIRSESGAWIFDSPVHNATAHYLHNLFFLLGDDPASSAMPLDVQAECYRVNAIENYDAAAVRCHVANHHYPDEVDTFFTQPIQYGMRLARCCTWSSKTVSSSTAAGREL